MATATQCTRNPAAHVPSARRLVPWLAASAAVLVVASAGAGQSVAGGFPFQPGEACAYQGNGPLGRMGSGTFAVERQDSAGREAYVLRFDFHGRLGFVGVENHTRSYFDPAETASFRFTKNERSPFSTSRQDVRIDGAARQWSGSGARGAHGGQMPTATPLDELSFIYFIRTLRLAEGDSYSFTRHYDVERNPVRVRVIGRTTTHVPAGDFQTIEVEMRVRDTHAYGGEGVIRLHFTDD